MKNCTVDHNLPRRDPIHHRMAHMLFQTRNRRIPRRGLPMGTLADGLLFRIQFGSPVD